MINKLCFLASILLLVACNDSTTYEIAATPDENPESIDVPEESASAGLLEYTRQDLDLPIISKPWTGDLDGMIKRRLIRVLTVYNLGMYFIDAGEEKGITYELFRMFEDKLNSDLKNSHVRVHVVFIPVARDELIPSLLSGRGDIAAAGLTITPERDEQVDFSNPLTRDLNEVLVTGPAAPAIQSIDDLAGREIYVRASSSYQSSLEELNRNFREQGKDEIIIQNISEFLEDEDIMEMVHSGALEWTVVDDYKARIWADVFENLTVREDIALRTGGQIALAFRKDSPELKAVLNEFLKTHRQGTLKGNILINRYLKEMDWTQNVLAAEDYERFMEVVDIFDKYGDEYGFDYLMVTAQGYQESRLSQSARSQAGAIGIMQLLPSTAADLNVGIPDISQSEANIHAGMKYLNFIRNRYFNEPGMDDVNKTLFALAAYNAGPARIARLRGRAEQEGYDPNKWFDHVEIIAAKEIGRETVQYVANIVKYYVVYRLSVLHLLKRKESREESGIE